MSPSGLHLNKPVVVIVGVIVVVTTWYNMSSFPFSSKSAEKLLVEIPKEKALDLEKMGVPSISVNVKASGKEYTIAYRETKASNSKLDVLLLHGQSFKSETWTSSPLHTLQLLFNLGFHAVAIDLPGYGNSSTATVDDPVEFLDAVIASLHLDRPVIVSPSMSGNYSLPFLFKDPENVLFRSRGFVPIAPVGTSRYKPEQYAALKIPTLVIYGENDKNLGKESTNNFNNLPNKKVVQLGNAEHACYINQPDEFHKHLYNFLLSLN